MAAESQEQERIPPIADNRRADLDDVLHELMEGADSAHFAVGYFFVNGLRNLADRLDELEEVRLLIGKWLESDEDRVDVIAQGLDTDGKQVLFSSDGRKTFTPGQKENALEETGEKLGEAVGLDEQSDEIADWLETFRDMLAEGRVKIRVYLKEKLHAKMYLVDHPDSRINPGVVGSSNLTAAGMNSNTELNAVVNTTDHHERLTEWFEELWEEAEPFEEKMIEVLDHSWALYPAKPFEVYLKILYELYQSHLRREDEEPADLKEDLEEKLYRFQRDAVVQSRNILREYGGVLLADVVGLGKTYMGSALLKDLDTREGWSSVVLSPASLTENWERVTQKMRAPARVFSQGLLRLDMDEHAGRWDQLNSAFSEAHVVLIDEAHHFRNPRTNSYENLVELLTEKDGTRKPVVLVTATPYNTRPHNIVNMFRLFLEGRQPEELPPLLRTHDLEDIPIRGGEQTREYMRELLENLMIRRTRSHVEKYYEDDLEDMGVNFPERRDPEPVHYSLDDAYEDAYSDVERLLDHLRYARYKVGDYVLPAYEEEEQMDQLSRAGEQLKGLIRVMLRKRLESSVGAFRDSIEVQIHVHETFLELVEQGVVVAKDLADEIRRADDDDVEDYEEFADEVEELTRDTREDYDPDKFDLERLKEDLDHDLDVLKRVKKKIEHVTEEKDSKLQRLKDLLTEIKQERPNAKVLVFSEFSATVEYIGEYLAAHLEKTEVTTGYSHGPQARQRIIGRFAPQANEYDCHPDDEIDILIATDVVGEGLNLQDSNAVINYDLHWNPVRLIQRIGRVDRVSTDYEEIYTWNFLPHREFEQNLSLEEVLKERFGDIKELVGDDQRYLSPDERVTDEFEYFKQPFVTAEESELEDEEERPGEEAISGMLEEARKVQREYPDFWERIENLPNRIRSAKPTEGAPGYIVFCRDSEHMAPKLVRVDEQGEELDTGLLSTLRELRCPEELEALELPERINRIVTCVEREYYRWAREQILETRQAKNDAVIRAALKKLRSLSRRTGEEGSRLYSEIKDRLINYKLKPAKRQTLQQIRTQVNEPLETLRELKEELCSEYDYHEENRREPPEADIRAEVVATMALR